MTPFTTFGSWLAMVPVLVVISVLLCRLILWAVGA